MSDARMNELELGRFCVWCKKNKMRKTHTGRSMLLPWNK